MYFYTNFIINMQKIFVYVFNFNTKLPIDFVSDMLYNYSHKEVGYMNYTLYEIIDIDKKYYMNTFGDRTKVAFENGEGIKLFSKNGEVFYDFMAGIAVNALGYGHKKYTDALKNQIDKLIHTSSLYYIENQAAAAKMLVEMSAFDKCFFANSGAEANEGAIKLARKYFYNKGIDKYEIISLKNSFHGRTVTTATATGQEKYRKPYSPLTPGFEYAEINNIGSVKEKITPHTAAVMLEFIQGESGVNVCTAEFIEGIKKLCAENNILLIADEVQTGMGRTGKMFAYEHYNIEPDIMTLAKALGGGVPIGALLAKDEIASAFTPGDHGTTFGGNPLCTGAAIAVMNIFKDEKIVENSAENGKYFMEKLKNLPQKFISEIRGKGLMIGVQFSSPIAGEVKAKLFENHILVGAVGGDILRILPPLIITKDEIDLFVNTLEKILTEEF